MTFNWQFDPRSQTLHAPSGYSITIRTIAQRLQDRVHNRFDLTGPWSGWKLRGQYLIGPGGIRVTPATLAAIKGSRKSVKDE